MDQGVAPNLAAAPPKRARRPRGPMLAQAGVLALVLAALAFVGLTATANLKARGIPLGLDFLADPAGFSVAETVLPYSSADPVAWAITVGVGNTLFVSALVIAFSSVLGLLLGVARLSENPLVAGLAKVWVEGVRNTPPILMLIFVYTIWWQLAPADRAVAALPGTLVSIRGLAVPALATPWSAGVLALAGLLGVLTAGLVLAGATPSRARRAAAAVLGLATVALLALTADGAFAVNLPTASGSDITGGARLTPELFAILFGLTLYTTGFIAEIVRGGINGVPGGQWEAARALGLGPVSVLRLVVLPQTLRLIVPPMTSQYINVIKNSTLALAVGYTDFLTIMGTVINKTSHAVEGTMIIILVYLAINLSLSAVLNWYNRRVAIEERA